MTTPTPTPSPSRPPTHLPPAAPLTGVIEGVYFDGRSSRDRVATLRVLRGGEDLAVLRVQAEGDAAGSEQQWPLRALHFDPPLPGVRRVVKLPDGGRFETVDDAAITALEAAGGRNRGPRGVRRLESNWPLTLGAVATLGLFVWGFLTYGLPAVARSAAAATPRSVLASFDRSATEVLDNGSFMGQTRLGAARQRQLQQGFRDVTRWAGGGYPYRLLLRDGEPEGSMGAIGTNAFALPGGTVVMTDQLVRLARDDRELLGVLAHEAGHVTGRHSLSGIYQGLGLTLLTTAVTGDLVSASTFAAAVPTWLLKNGYSRQAETQSDEVAGRFLMERYGTTKPLRDVLARLDTEDAEADENSVTQDDPGSFLQTHPGTAERIRHLREIEQNWGKKR
ncbi:M48 family metallopeptidase [Deinococcus wulumuqiensis]|uniref:Peptidase M48 domain-containing protein n=1 Tax=Deinococcus wulumuqiensis TaxID=980427 RepID=A0AAV4K7N1_9DEIO|nr:M48 family metallopeptidase [Deinococcus wulumuqiensis]QII21176.1 M48 family metallopeptidase [Deinococcus wulumuqiensis R12]GGI83448.1 hypothetical protein GCM10010914_17160 [Deinococcus wulumuqiensis]GGP29648.1 hypothetical protein GCM10008021_12990 [Deinococcus wulumuqiensis]